MGHQLTGDKVRKSVWIKLRPPLAVLVTSIAVCLALAMLTLVTSRFSMKYSGGATSTTQSQHVKHGEENPITRVAVVLQKHFPQTNLCGGDSWKANYAQVHADIISGKRPPRFITSVAHNNGVADRLTGMVSEFYLALLSNRALTAVTEGDLPGFEAACDMPYINWTHPFAYPPGVTDNMKWVYQGLTGHSNGGNRGYPPTGPINNSMYYAHFLLNQDGSLGFFREQNLTNFPDGNTNVPYVLSGSNRGQTFKLVAFNPFHKQQLWTYGLTPERAFMCGFFYLCSPNSVVQQLYKPYWDALSQPNTLKIGINVRVGDHVFKGDTQLSIQEGAKQLAAAALYFRCAEKLEKAFATAGQAVVWYVISDSLALRKAAKNMYGDKILTDLGTKVIHPDCHTHNPHACQKSTMDLSMQHSIGQMVTYSLADYHIMTKASGFGRLGAWLSGKYANLYELHIQDAISDSYLEKACNPLSPTHPEESAATWAQM